MPTPRQLLPLFITCLIALGSSTATAQQKGPLVQQYQPGKTYLLEVATLNETHAEPSENPLPTTTHITQTFELKAVKDGEQTLVKVSLSSIKATISLGGQLQQQYDSANPALSPPLLQQAFGAIKDKTFIMVYDSQHRFVKFLDLPADDQTPLGKQTAVSSLQFAEAFRQQRDGVLPITSPANGTWTWENRLQLPPLGELQLKGRGTLDIQLTSDNLQPATIEGTLEIAPSLAPDATPLTISEGKFNGTLAFDPAQHQTKKLETITSLLINRPEQPPIHFKQTDTITLLSITDTAP